MKSQERQTSSAAEIVDGLTKIISIQSKVINELYAQLLQYTTIEELENTPITEKINAAAKLRTDLDI